jgi:Protein of unknown function (DUF1573)
MAASRYSSRSSIREIIACLHNSRFWNAFGILLTICLLWVCWLQGDEKPAPELAPKIVLNPATLDLGSLPQQTQKTFELKIANEGTKNLIIRGVTASCGCTAAVVSQKTIKPGVSGKVRVTFKSSSFSGTVEKSVLITSNDPQTPVKEFTFTAFVTPSK